MKTRIQTETEYWQANALDENVDVKFICDIDTDLCKQDIYPLRGSVLEIGCGVGRLLQDGGYGVDISQNMIDIARTRNPSLHLKICDGRTIPYEDDTFDSVFCYLVFQHLPPVAVRKYINEAHRVLTNGGVFVFQFIVGDEREPFSNHYSEIEVQEMTKKFDKTAFKPSIAYSGWTIASCIK